MSALADSGIDLVIVGFDLTEYVYDVALAHPDTTFVTFGPVPIDFGLPNVTTVYSLDEAAGSYLAGAAAALASETGTIGFLGGHQATIDVFRSGFEAGARSVDPDVEVLSTFVMQTGGMDVFTKPEAGAAAARVRCTSREPTWCSMPQGRSGDLVPQVADEQSDELGRHLWVIGVDTDQWLQVTGSQREHVLTSMLKRHDVIVNLAVERYLAGEIEPGALGLGIADGVLSLADSRGQLSETASARLAEIEADLRSGVIRVPDVPDGPPTSLARADAVVTVAFTGDRCIIEGLPTTFANDRVLRIEFENASDDIGSVVLEYPGSWLLTIPPENFTAFRLDAQPGAGNAGVIRPIESGMWTIDCAVTNTSEHASGRGLSSRCSSLSERSRGAAHEQSQRGGERCCDRAVTSDRVAGGEGSVQPAAFDRTRRGDRQIFDVHRQHDTEVFERRAEHRASDVVDAGPILVHRGCCHGFAPDPVRHEPEPRCPTHAVPAHRDHAVPRAAFDLGEVAERLDPLVEVCTRRRVGILDVIEPERRVVEEEMHDRQARNASWLPHRLLIAPLVLPSTVDHGIGAHAPEGTDGERAVLGERRVEGCRITLELAVNLQLSGPHVGLFRLAPAQSLARRAHGPPKSFDVHTVRT